MAWSNGYIISFAAGVCVVCSLGVASASMGLRPFQEANELNAFQKKVLAAVDLPAKVDGRRPAMDKAEVDAMFSGRLKLIVVDANGAEALTDATREAKLAAVDEARAAAKGTGQAPALNPVYIRVSEDGSTNEAYALELNGKGLWGPISGYLALTPDGKTVKNVAFDAPKETPGLGAEIMTDKFQDQWIGKSITAGGKIVPIDVAKGSATLACPGRVDNCVDGVSGATITCRGVDEMVEVAIEKNYAKYLTNLQKGG
jgi:Na+-transporting NADH:ubiquinone oxidoreductase subunit C